MSPEERIKNVLNRLGNVKSAGDRQFYARCPAHDDRENSLSIGLGRDDRILLKCHRVPNCSFEAILAAAGLQRSDVSPPSGGYPKRSAVPKRRLSLARFAESKGFEPRFLENCGIREKDGYLIIEYSTLDGAPAARHRIRRAVKAKEGSSWTDGPGDLVPYGLRHLSQARERGELTIVEGETDWLTLHYHGYPALGIPGAGFVKKTLRREHLDGISVIYALQEPDDGGTAFIEHLSELLRSVNWPGLA